MTFKSSLVDLVCQKKSDKILNKIDAKSLKYKPDNV